MRLEAGELGGVAAGRAIAPRGAGGCNRACGASPADSAQRFFSFVLFVLLRALRAKKLSLTYAGQPESIRPQALERLVNEIRQGRYHLTTGFVGTPYVCHVLSRYGYTDVAYELLTQERYPSWLYPVKQGATTIWERWDGIKPDGSFQDASMNSFNHYAYGAIGEWLYRVVAGIELDPTAPGYKRFRIQPQPGGQLTYVNAALDSLYGRIESRWSVEGDCFQLAVTIPANTEGIVQLVAHSPEQITEQGQALDQVAGIRELRQEGGLVLLTLGSGCYHFRVAAP